MHYDREGTAKRWVSSSWEHFGTRLDDREVRLFGGPRLTKGVHLTIPLGRDLVDLD